MTSTRKTHNPIADLLATSLPQLGPISSVEMSPFVTPTDCSIAVPISLPSVGVSGSVSMMMLFLPAVVTTTCWAAAIPVPETSSRSLSALSWVTWPLGMETVNCAPPRNSRPKLRPLK